MTPTEQAAAQRCADLCNAEPESDGKWKASDFDDSMASAGKAFRKYVARTSEIAEEAIRGCYFRHLDPLILPKQVDVLATVFREADPERDDEWDYGPYAEALRKALSARGLKIVEAGDE